MEVINFELLAVIKLWRPRRRAPDAAKQVLRRAEASLALLPALFAAGGRIPSGALIPLLQALAQGLTVARLDLLHVKAAGACFFVRAFSLSLCHSSQGILPCAIAFSVIIEKDDQRLSDQCCANMRSVPHKCTFKKSLLTVCSFKVVHGHNQC